MRILIILFLASVPSIVFTQQVSEWQNYTDMKNVRSIVIENDKIWAASEGGAFSYDLINGSYKKYSKVEGLNGINITAAAIDKYGKIWLGSSNGVIDVYDPQANTFHTILDIFNNTQKTSKGINELSARGDTIFVATEFGVSLINANNYLFFDTFSKFGELPSNTAVNNVFNSDRMFICTDVGISIQKEGTTNLSAPESWNVYRITSGLPADSTIKIVSYNNMIIAATLRGLSVFNDSAWSVFLPELTNTLINDIIVAENSLFIISSSQHVYKYEGTLTQIYSAPGPMLTRLAFSPATGILIASTQGILRLNDGSFLFPNGPAANKFPDLGVDNNGTLWSGSGSDATAVGFYSYDGNNWRTFNASTTEALTSNTYFKVFSASNNRMIFGNWGQGIAVFQNGEIKTYKENLDFTGTPRDPNFIVITGIAEDSKNNIWLLNYGALDRKNLTVSSDLENWSSHSISAIGNTYVDDSYNLVIDQYDTKWFGVQRGKQGLFYFNEGNNPDPSATSDDYSGYLNEASGLSNSFVTSIAVDRRGDIWVGTGLGVSIISRVNTVLSANPQLNISSVFSLRQQTITDILVDPLNQKWIGTNLGLFVVNSDGTSLLASFNSKNSGLLSDNIRSLTMDENTGVIYAGTDNGLTSFKTFSVKPVEGFNGITAFPNPFIIGEGGEQLIIEGLIADTDIKILSITGKLVNEYSTPGGRIASWDGKDQNGDFVSSGVYFIVAFDQEGNSVEKGKVAVIRK
jgi:ligand-binding sensor domain-containing protein